MKKGILHTAMPFSFFIRIPCKNLYIQSVRCKLNATWSEGPLFKIFRANNFLDRATLNCSNTAKHVVVIQLNKFVALFRGFGTGDKLYFAIHSCCDFLFKRSR
jgi:hypothetical protein